ncbi:tail completion protein gp17 [Neisseria musculi]|uniref:DUF3168 domain-containing protein n=1 Tax=Neisseria musculi TaxID=1815583 RepID=A0A7H1MAM9_9NEIS|nr:DUF3168 domain-containing protein [Neisseria musculi]QNT58694.1 hypothetical protein H7A79_1623 [Neisseria musculi]
MAVEALVVRAVKSVSPETDVYHDFAPDNAVVPFVVIQRVGGEGNLYLDNQTGGGYQVRVQVSVWAADRLAAVELSQQIESALSLQARSAALGAALSAYDPDTGWRGMQQDFYVFS